jgi:hypothetical protein
VDLSTRTGLLRIRHKDNVVLRGLTLRRYATDQNASPLFVINSGERMGHGLLVEDCVFEWNNGVGLRYIWSADVTLRGNRFNYNGYRGEGGHTVRNVLAEDNEANFNNWRGYWGGFTGWAVAGSKSVHVRDMLLRDYRTVGNLAHGYWLDISCQNIIAEGMFAAFNRSSGFFFEISDGPFQLTHSIYAYNGVGLLVQGSDRVQAHHNIFVGNGQQLRMVHEREFGRGRGGGNNPMDNYYGTQTRPLGRWALGRVSLSDNLFVVTEPQTTQFIAVRFQEDFPERRQHFYDHWLQMSDNQYAARGEGVFGPSDLRHQYGRRLLPQRDAQVSFDQWQSMTGQDSTSTVVSADTLTWADDVPTTEALAEASPFLQRGVTPALRAEAEAFFDWAGVPRDEVMNHDVFLDEFQAEPGD